MSYAKKAFSQAAARFKATLRGRDYVMTMVAGDKKNHGLVKVSKDTGEIVATIDMGKDKQPKYGVDDISGRVIYRPAESQVVCYQL